MNATLELETKPAHHIATLLAGTCPGVREAGPAAWSLQPSRREAQVEARLVDDWLQLAAGPLSPSAVTGGFLPETLLRWNSALAGNARFGVDADFAIRLGAEVPSLEDYDPGPCLSQAWTGLEQGLDWIHGGTVVMAEARAGDATILKPIAEATGWAFHERQDGRLDFILDASATASASAQTRADGSVRVWLTLATLDGLSEASRRAVAVLLLRAGAVLRWARPVIVADAAGTSAVLEVIFATAPETRELGLALESLAVGAGLTAAEVKLICHEKAAKELLIVGNWAPQETHNKQQPKDHAW